MHTARLRHSIVRMFSGNAIFAVSQFGMVMVVAKLAGPEALGTYVLANAIVTPAFAFSGLGLPNSLSTDVSSRYSFFSYVQLCALSSLLAFASCLGIAMVGDRNSVVVLAIVAMSIARIAENGSQLCYGIFQFYEHMELISRSLIFRGGLGVVALIGILAVYRGRIEFAIFGLALSWMLIVLLHDVPRVRRFPCVSGAWNGLSLWCDLSEVRALAAVVLPLGVLALITSLGVNVPRYFIELQLGTRELGYFAAVVQLANVGAVIVNAVGQTIVPRLAKYHLQQPNEYGKLLFKALMLAAIIGSLGIAVAWFCGGELLLLFYSNAFVAYAETLVPAMIWAAILYISATLGCAMTAIRSFRSQAIIGCVALFAMLLVCWPFIDRFGIVGAVYALIFSVSIKILLQVVVLVRSLRKIRL